MKHGDGGKGPDRRPGEGYEENYELIWPSKKKVAEVPAEDEKEKDDE